NHSLRTSIGRGENQGVDTTVVIVVIVVVTLLLLIVGILSVGIFLFWKKRKSKDKPAPGREDLELNTHNKSVEISAKLSGITLQHKIGAGNFGEVYCGMWTKTPVALKKINSEELGFLKELSM